MKNCIVDITQIEGAHCRTHKRQASECIKAELDAALKVVEAARLGMQTGSSEALRDALREYDRDNS